MAYSIAHSAAPTKVPPGADRPPTLATPLDVGHIKCLRGPRVPHPCFRS